MHSPGAGGAQVAIQCWGTPKEMEQVLQVVESFHPGWRHSECSSSWAVISKPVNLRWNLLSETQLGSSKQAGLLSWGRGNLGTHSWGSKQVTKDFGYVLHLVLFGGCDLRNIQEWCQKCDNVNPAFHHKASSLSSPSSHPILVLSALLPSLLSSLFSFWPSHLYLFSCLKLFECLSLSPFLPPLLSAWEHAVILLYLISLWRYLAGEYWGSCQ